MEGGSIALGFGEAVVWGMEVERGKWGGCLSTCMVCAGVRASSSCGGTIMCMIVCSSLHVLHSCPHVDLICIATLYASVCLIKLNARSPPLFTVRCSFACACAARICISACRLFARLQRRRVPSSPLCCC